MSGEWPTDPTDPRCPECGEPVSATSTFCMHCEADLPPAGFGAGEPSAAPADGQPMDEADPGMPSRDRRGDATASTGGATGTTVARERVDEAAAWIDPDGLLDDVSTVMVAAVAAVASLVLVVVVGYGLLPEVASGLVPWLALAAGAGAGLWVGHTRTVFGAARKAGLAVGGLLALLPVVFAVALDWQSIGDAVGGVFVFGLFLWPVALVVAGVGWLLGYGGVDGE